MQPKVLETAWWPELSVFSTTGCSVSQTFWFFYIFFFPSAHWVSHNRKFWLIILEIKYHSTLNHRRVGYISSSSQSSCLSHLLLPEEEPWTSQDLRCKKHKLHNTKSVETHLIAQSFPFWVNRLVCTALKKGLWGGLGLPLPSHQSWTFKLPRDLHRGQYLDSWGCPHLTESGQITQSDSK